MPNDTDTSPLNVPLPEESDDDLTDPPNMTDDESRDSPVRASRTLRNNTLVDTSEDESEQIRHFHGISNLRTRPDETC